jgi:hypothetical protein
MNNSTIPSDSIILITSTVFTFIITLMDLLVNIYIAKRNAETAWLQKS